MNLEQGVVTFKSTHHAIKGEKILIDNSIEHKTIPTPRAITRSCGLSVKFNLEDAEKIRELFAQEEVSIEGIYKKNGSNYKEIEG